MNQSEKEVLAKWIAEKVLGGIRLTETNCQNYCIPKVIKELGTHWVIGKAMFDIQGLSKYIFSPKGFFAVWDVVDNKYNTIDIWQSTIKDLYFNGDSKDRYEAFYKSVKEVWVD